jgi:subtilase family serine protease
MGRVLHFLKWAKRSESRKARRGKGASERARHRFLTCEALEVRTLLSTVPFPAALPHVPTVPGPAPLPHLPTAPAPATLPHSTSEPAPATLFHFSKDTSPTGYTPNAIRSAYGLGSYLTGVLTNGISFGGIAGDGRGQTIAIIDPYDYPTALTDLNAFSSYFGLPQFNGSGEPTFQQLTQTGQPVSSSTTSPNYVGTDPYGPSYLTGFGDWEGEESLDIEWAHAIAPMANIILFEGADSSNNLANLFTAAKTAANTAGVVAVVMSWDINDPNNPNNNPNFTLAQAATYDSTVFTTPTGHVGGSATLNGTGIAGGVTFFAASGDAGAYDDNNDPTTIAPEYPTDSVNVVSVGGTLLTVNQVGTNYTYGSETTWGTGTNTGTDSQNGTGENGGGGGGVSTFENQPSYQAGVVSSSLSTNEGGYSTPHRTFPDVSIQAAPFSPDYPNQGLPIYDSYDGGTFGPWGNGVGGTSIATPMWAGLVALADQGRAVVGLGSLDGPSQTLPALYKLPSADFHDITTGSIGPSPEFAAAPGYDLASGLGTPVANKLVPALVGYTPTVTSLSTAAGLVSGGTTVTITGTDLTAGTVVDFGSTPATSVVVVSSTKITAVSPAGTGTVDVTVIGPGGVSATSSADQFTYVAPPAVTGLSPVAGLLAGGTSVTIAGSSFTGITAVKFGSTVAALSSLVYNANGTVTITSPAHAGGNVDVTVTTPFGTSTIPSADQYTYTNTPVVATVTPAAGPLAGGTSVTLAGGNLTGITAVKFGNTLAALSGITYNSNGSITIASPAEPAGVVNVTVTGPGGTSPISTADQFTYLGTPTVSSVAPTAGPLAGGASVTIAGANLLFITAVDFGSTPAALTSLVYNSNGTVTINSPAESVGTVDVVVTTAGGISPTSTADQFTYQAAPTVASISPNVGTLAGGTPVTITGTNLTGITAVDFGSTAAALSSLIYNSDGTVTINSPAESAGTVDVTVTTAGGISATSVADRFTYTNRPTVTSVIPAVGPALGGTSVTIAGANLSSGITAVDFGSTAASLSSLIYNSNGSITVVSPASGAGTVNVTVQTANGTSAITSAGQFTYLAAATVSGVSSTVAAGAYKAGTVIPITLTWLEPVVVTGSPSLTLNISGATAAYVSGSGSSSLTFNYTVAAGQDSSDLDYASTAALVLNGGTIKDMAGTAAVLTLPATGTDGLATRNIVIDTMTPAVGNVTSTVAAGTYEAGAVIPITVAFSEAVTVTGTPLLALNASGAVAYYTSGSGTATLTFNYTVAVGQSSLDLDYTSTAALALNGATVQDAAGNVAALTLPATGTDGLATRNIVIDSSPPTVATAASATPTPVTGTTVNLSVLGADVDSGEASLKYTWIATSNGLAAPTFSANGTNAAKNNMATFHQAGVYLFTVTIADPEGLTTTSSVSVTVDQTWTSVAVSPASVTLYYGASQQFTVTAKDQFNLPLTTQPAFTWTTTVGSITGSGLLTVPTSSATGTVMATSGAFYGTAAVNVIQPVNTAYLINDPVLTGKTSLEVFGWTAADVILVNPGTVAGQVSVEINGKPVGTFQPTGRIIAHGATGPGYSDYIGVSSQVTLPAWIYGDSGADTLVGGGGPNILVGGTGKSTLYGGAGRNILIGGGGNDLLMGGAGDGLLIGGSTAYNGNDLALLAIMSEWNSGDSYATRAAYLTGQTGGLNGSYFLNSGTVTDQGESDTIRGANANDVFFQGVWDSVFNRRANEVLVSLPASAPPVGLPWHA